MPDDSKHPVLSVVMPVWNGAVYLKEAIQSILDQTFSDFEFLIIDDGSTDRTAEIIKSYTDPRIRFFQLKHGGIVKALNFGVSESRAKWIARMDSDDVAHPTRFEIQLQRLNRTPNSVACYTNVALIGEKEFFEKSQHFPRTRGLLAMKLCSQSPIIHSSVIFNKSMFLAVGGYMEHERHAEDYSLWGRMLDSGDFIGVSAKLMKFRAHQKSISKQKADIQNDLTMLIGQEHCRRFMNLSAETAKRAHSAILSRNSKQLFEWVWFITNCLPRLKWQSLELWAWIAMQTIRRILGVCKLPN